MAFVLVVTALSSMGPIAISDDLTYANVTSPGSIANGSSLLAPVPYIPAGANVSFLQENMINKNRSILADGILVVADQALYYPQNNITFVIYSKMNLTTVYISDPIDRMLSVNLLEYNDSYYAVFSPPFPMVLGTYRIRVSATTNNGSVVDANTSFLVSGMPSGTLSIATDHNAYYPGETVGIQVYGAFSPTAYLIDAVGNVYELPLDSINGTIFESHYYLTNDTTAGNYSVIVEDHISNISANITFQVTANGYTMELNNSTEPVYTTTTSIISDVGIVLSANEYLPGDKVSITAISSTMPAVSVVNPQGESTWISMSAVDDHSYTGVFDLNRTVALGNYTITTTLDVNGTYRRAQAYFNVTMAARSDKAIGIQYAVYDVAQKDIILKANVNTIAKGSKGAIMGVSRKENIVGSSFSINIANPSNESMDIIVPAGYGSLDDLCRQYNVNKNISKATMSSSISPDMTKIDISLNNKTDGNWYKLSARNTRRLHDHRGLQG